KESAALDVRGSPVRASPRLGSRAAAEPARASVSATENGEAGRPTSARPSSARPSSARLADGLPARRPRQPSGGQAAARASASTETLRRGEFTESMDADEDTADSDAEMLAAALDDPPRRETAPPSAEAMTKLAVVHPKLHAALISLQRREKARPSRKRRHKPEPQGFLSPSSTQASKKHQQTSSTEDAADVLRRRHLEESGESAADPDRAELDRSVSLSSDAPGVLPAGPVRISPRVAE
ncbi:MAG: hypothetical protein VX563_02415, partial [Planctomycetota bacterium]|nr:hypothetical protein [Planctomycetota bacterium]